MFVVMCLQRSASSTSSWSRYLSRQTFVGTPNYMAPEVMLQNDEGYVFWPTSSPFLDSNENRGGSQNLQSLRNSCSIELFVISCKWSYDMEEAHRTHARGPVTLAEGKSNMRQRLQVQSVGRHLVVWYCAAGAGAREGASAELLLHEDHH